MSILHDRVLYGKYNMKYSRISLIGIDATKRYWCIVYLTNSLSLPTVHSCRICPPTIGGVQNLVRTTKLENTCYFWSLLRVQLDFKYPNLSTLENTRYYELDWNKKKTAINKITLEWFRAKIKMLCVRVFIFEYHPNKNFQFSFSIGRGWNNPSGQRIVATCRIILDLRNTETFHFYA